jgi:hypothetical protein
MLNWSEDFSGFSLEQIVKLQMDNRAWNRTLRLQSSALVNSRLANQIDRDGYIERRKTSQAEAMECRRRSDILLNEISTRQVLAGASR